MCQKEEFHTRKKQGEGMISQQTTERKEEKKGKRVWKGSWYH